MQTPKLHEEDVDIKSIQDLVFTKGGGTVHHHLAFKPSQVDTAAELVAGKDIELDPAEALRIRRRIDWHVMPLMCSTSYRSQDSSIVVFILINAALYCIQYIDKTTLGSSAILGIRFV